MKFKMIAGCLAAALGLGLVSVGAHATEKRLPVLFSLTSGYAGDNPNSLQEYPYLQARFENGRGSPIAALYPNYPLGTGRKEWSLHWRPTTEGKPYPDIFGDSLAMGDIPHKLDVHGVPVPGKESHIAQVEIRKTDKKTGTKYLYFSRKFFDEKDIPNGNFRTAGGRLLAGNLPKVNETTEKLIISVTTSPKTGVSRIISYPGSSVARIHYTFELQIR